MKPAPIALFVYNRLGHTQKTVQALLQNSQAAESDLLIFSDGPKNDTAEKQVADVRQFVAGLTGFKSVKIFQSDRNKGLARSIIDGVTQVLEENDRVIVVEDDLITSPHFLTYLNRSLELYEQDEAVISIHGYVYPVKEKLPETFFLKGADCWGWATWRRGWELFNEDGQDLLRRLKKNNMTHEFDFGGSFRYTKMLKDQIWGANDSWAIRWYASAFLENKLTLYPGASLVNNIGHDLSGRHSWKTDRWETRISPNAIVPERIPLVENSYAKEIIAKYFRNSTPAFYKKVFNKIRFWFLHT